MKTERRKKRSKERMKAAELYLDAARERARAKAVALANEDGLVVSGSGPGEMLAVLAVLGVSPELDLREAFAGDEPIHSTPLDLAGMRLHLTSLGGAPIPAHDASRAISRILFPEAVA
jgi:hypothetical protein